MNAEAGLKEPIVDFLLIGGTKAGTESIYEYFRRHPDVSVGGEKEKHYFCQGIFGPDYTGLAVEITSLGDYVRQLPSRKSGVKVGDFDPLTLHGPTAPQLIAQVNPKARIMLILRNPIERAYSHFWMDVREGFEDRPFDFAVKADHALYASGSKRYCPLIRLGFYAKQLREFIRVFGPDQVKVWLYEDYNADPAKVLDEMCRFAGVGFEPLAESGVIRENVAGVPRSFIAAGLLRARRTWLRPIRDVYVKLPLGFRRFVKNTFLIRRIKVPPMSPDVRQFLSGIYKDDIKELESIVNRDLTAWLRDPANPMALPIEFQEAQKAKQAQYFDEATDDEFEIERPRKTGRLYEWSIRHKFDTALRQLSFPLRGHRLLDICCGSGMAAEFYAEAGADVTGLDISERSISRARERAKRHQFNATFVVGDAENLPYPDKSFDVVTVHDGLHHLPDPHRAIREMLRVARKAIVVIEPARSWLTRRAVNAGMALDYEDAGNYVYRFREEEIFDLAKGAGYEKYNYEQYLLYYRHEPFSTAKLFENTPLFHVFPLTFGAVSYLAHRLGNKISVVCER
jgi:ubiquinone/menaquinone biosynthesis C-methylase UbiE